MWLKHFDEYTRVKAAGRTRLLLVDGHNSHYTLEFLQYAISANIEVLCYPAHATHIYQGLDVVIFSVLKKCWSEEKDIFFRETGQKVTKDTFLKIYAQAHLRALSEENIKAAFSKTGAWPFNPNKVTTEMLAPSLETSTIHTSLIQQTSPIRTISKLISQYSRHSSNSQSLSSITTTVNTTPQQGPVVPIDPVLLEEDRRTLTELASSSASFLISSSPIRSTSNIPVVTYQLSTPPRLMSNLLESPPKSLKERNLQAALRESREREAYQRGVNVGLQSSLVLQDAHNKRLRAQLGAQELNKKRKSNEKLIGDGLPRLLTGPDFVDRVIRFKATQEERAAEKERNQKRRHDMDIVLADEVEEWGREERERKVINAAALANWHAEVAEWEIERDRARTFHKRPAWMKPKKPVFTKGRQRPGKRLRRCAEHDVSEERVGDQPDIGGSAGGSKIGIEEMRTNSCGHATCSAGRRNGNDGDSDGSDNDESQLSDGSDSIAET